MESINQNYNLKIEILSPVHVGGGSEKNWVQGIDYIIDEGLLYVIDTEKLYNKLIDIQLQNNKTALDVYTNALSKNNISEIEKLLRANQIDFDDISDTSYHFDNKDENKTPSSEIKSLIRNGLGKPYIPGSSIKGAIKSILFNYLFRKVRPKVIDKYYDNELFGNINANIMRYLRITDAEFTNTDTDLCNVRLFNLYKSGLWRSKYKDGFTVWHECFAFDTTSETRCTISDGLIQLIRQKSPDKLPANYKLVIAENNPIQFIFKLINNYTNSYIQKEIDFFKKFNQAPRTDEIISILEEFKDLTVDNTDSCILRMACGSGFYGISGDWRIADHLTTIDTPDEKNWVYSQTLRQKAPAHYKSRKIITNFDEYMPMGFIRLELPENVARVEKIFTLKK